MNRLLFISFFLILGISLLAGCGGGGGGGKIQSPLLSPNPSPSSSPDVSPSPSPSSSPDVSPSPSPTTSPDISQSSDYFGLEVGYTRNYNGTFSDSEQGSFSFTATQKVLEELEPGLFKTQNTTSVSDLLMIDGDFIEKNADGHYYDRGYWDEEEVYLDEDPPTEDYIIISNPVYLGYHCWYYGTVIDRVEVSVPAGKFTAWLFEDTWEDEEEGVQYSGKIWFVPYIGIVKSSTEGIKNEETIVSGEYSLTSYYISSSVASSSFVGQSINNAANSPILLKLQKIILKRKK